MVPESSIIYFASKRRNMGGCGTSKPAWKKENLMATLRRIKGILCEMSQKRSSDPDKMTEYGRDDNSQDRNRTLIRMKIQTGTARSLLHYKESLAVLL